MPRFVVPSLFFPSRRSVSASSSWWYGQDQVGVAADEQTAAVDALRGESVELREQHRGVHHDAVADDGRDVVVQDAARHELQREGLTADDDRVARVVPALVADDDLHLLGNEVGELALALVAPLRTDHDGCGHRAMVLNLEPRADGQPVRQCGAGRQPEWLCT